LSANSTQHFFCKIQDTVLQPSVIQVLAALLEGAASLFAN